MNKEQSVLLGKVEELLCKGEVDVNEFSEAEAQFVEELLFKLNQDYLSFISKNTNG